MTVIERERVVTETERRARVLEAAALEIEVRGWMQGDVCNDAGNLCLVGAIWAARGLDPRVTEDADGGQASWMSVWGEVDVPLLSRFNDIKGRTADEVTFLLRWRASEIRDGL